MAVSPTPPSPGVPRNAAPSGVTRSRNFTSLARGIVVGSPPPPDAGRASTAPSDDASGDNESERPKRFKVPEVERCRCCSIDDFWAVYDCFRLMDKRNCGSIARSEFYEAITAHPTLEMRRVMKRCGLHDRFRRSNVDVSLEEFIRLIWPYASGHDMETMRHWSCLREAHSVLKEPTFVGEHADLRHIFDLLDIDGSRTISVNELLRSRILSKEDVSTLVHTINVTEKSLSFKAFCKVFTEVWKPDAHFKDVGGPQLDWKKPVRGAFRNSKLAVLTERADRDGETTTLPAIVEASLESPAKSRWRPPIKHAIRFTATMQAKDRGGQPLRPARPVAGMAA